MKAAGILTIMMVIGVALSLYPLPQGGTVGKLGEIIPRAVGGWHAAGEDADYDRRTLYDYMDGGAEVYLAFDFREVFSRKYSGPSGIGMSLDVKDPAAINPVGRSSFEGFANGIALRGTFAFVSDEAYGVRKFDIGHPASPRLVASYRTTGEPYGIRVSDDGLIIVSDSFSLFILK